MGDLIVDELVRKLILSLNDTSLNRDKLNQTYVKDINSSFLSEHTKSELDVALSVLFRSENSLLDFINRGCCEKTLKGGVRDSLSLIIDLLGKYKKELVQYFVPIKDSCFNVIKRNCGADVQEKAYKIIKTIISSKESAQVEVDLQIPLLVDFLHGRGLTDKSIRSLALQGVYEVYGAIAEHYPNRCNGNRINSLVRNILHELHNQMKKTNYVKPSVIEGCMNALKGVMVSFTRAYDDENPSESKEIYSYVRDASAFQEDAHRRVYQRAALNLFKTHIAQLWGWVMEGQDYKFWLKDLQLWAARSSPEDRKAGLETMEAFHKQAWMHISAHPEDSMKNDFILHYRNTMTNPRVANYEINLAIEGFCALAEVCSREFNQEDVSFMFRVILQRAQIGLTLEEENIAAKGEEIAKYLESLTKICAKLHSVTSDQLSALTRLWRLAVERYPHHYHPAQYKIVRSLTLTILNMGLCDVAVFDRFLYPVVYQSVIVTCGHSLVEEADLQEELTGKAVITYKNYLKLWEGLFRIGYEDSGRVQGITLALRRSILEKLYDCFIKSLIAILEKLNVGYKKEEAIDAEMRSDPEIILKGEVPQDHSVLCNLANLYKDLLATLSAEKITKWLAELITTVVNQSVRFPMVSAFYKLLAAILSVAQRANYFVDETEETRSLGVYVTRYLEDVMLHCKQYKNDLQASCLLAIVAVPIPLIDPLLEGIAPITQMIFLLGQSLLSLAHHGMGALELWQRKLSPENLKPILHQVLPLFDPYLRSRGITTELPEDEGLQLSKRQQKRERRIQKATELSNLQKRMLRLLSLLDSATCLRLLNRPADITAWSTEPVVPFNLPFPDQRFYVDMDPLLPRVVELALTSSDRQTKAAACEVLHAFVIIFIGKSQELIHTKEPTVVGVLARLFPALLRLSCGSDLVARQLFHPLTFQLLHWFSSRTPTQSQKQAVLQAVWDGITDEEDSALQDFSALCLQEFVAWAIKQSTPGELASSKRAEGPRAVIRQIKSYCLDPSPNKRRGAMVAFCHVAKLLREETALVDIFWLELLYHLVRGAELGNGGHCHDHPATTALDHATKVLRKNADLFNKDRAALDEKDRRRVPEALGSGLLRDVVKFLLQKCGSKSAMCAEKCREMLLALMPLVSESPRPDQLANLVAVCEGAGTGSVLPFQPSMLDDFLHLCASIDCYAWCIKKGFISPTEAIKPPSRLVASVEYFINLIDLSVVPTTMCSKQDSALVKAKLDVVAALFDLLALFGSFVKDLPYTFFGKKFWKLLSTCILSPRHIGLDWRNQLLSTSLTDKLRLLLCTLRDNLDTGKLQEMYDKLSELVPYDCESCLDRLSHACQGLRQLEVKDREFIDGLITLHKTDILQHILHGFTWNGNRIVSGVFSSLFGSEGLPLHPETSVKDFASRLLYLAVMLGAEVRATLACVMDSTEVSDPHISPSATTLKGQHFLTMYEDCLINHLLQDPNLSVSRLLDRPSDTNIQMILLMLSASKYSKVKFNRSAEALLSSLTAAWPRLEAFCAGVRQSQMVSLVQGLVQLLPPSAVVGGLSAPLAHPALASWLFRQIKDSAVRLEYKPDLVELLPSVITEGTELQLEEVLRHLQSQFPVSSGELRPASVERNTFVSVYTALLRTLVATGSITVLRAVCESAADKDHACADAITSALEDFVQKHNEEVQTQALKMVHDKFLDETKSVDFRLGLVSRFLIPLLCKASKAAVTQFYTDKIQNIIDVFEEKLRIHDQEWKSKQQLVRKIGACRLVENMFCRLEKSQLENASSSVVKAASIPAGFEKIIKYFAKRLYEIKSLNCSREELQELFRQFHCAALNAMAAFVCNTNQELKFSVMIFKDDSAIKIWQRIVPTEPKYTFPIDFDDYPKIKKQLVQIRSLTHVRGSGGEGDKTPALYLPSQSLFNSSLQEDITNFDFSMYNVRDTDRMQQVLGEEGKASAAGLDLEEDCLNNHECMATLCAAVKHLCETFPVTGPKEQLPQPPIWMVNLRSALVAASQPDNCRAFIIKLILNCQAFFKPFAHYWITPIVQAVIDNCVGDRINYLVHDIVCMLYDWQTVAIPDSTTEEKLKASEFLRMLVLRTNTERIAVLTHSIETIRCVVTMWKSFLSVPYQELLDLIRPPSAQLLASASGTSMSEPGIYLADAFVANGILPFNLTGKSTYCDYLLIHLQRPDRKIYKNCAKVIGQILKILSPNGDLQGEDLQFFNRVKDAIRLRDGRNNFETQRNLEQFIISLYEIQCSFRPIVQGFEAQCINNLNSPGEYPTMLLKILTTALDSEFCNDAFYMLVDLPRLVKNESNPEQQVAALELIRELVSKLTPSQMKDLLPSVVALQKHKMAKTRGVVYDIVEWIYDNYRNLRDGIARDMVEDAKGVLIAGLADPDSKQQAKVFSFWSSNDRLPSHGWGRLVSILKQLYSSSSEAVFLTVVTSLLLDLCQQTDEYKRSIFSEPLSNCPFEEYAVSGSYRTRHAVFVPMFADTLASQISSLSMGSFTDFNFQLRATQSPSSMYSATLQPSISSYVENQSLYRGPIPSSSSAPFGQKYKQGPNFGSEFLAPKDATDGEAEPLLPRMFKKRLLRDQKKVGHAMAELNMAKAAKQQHQKVERQRRREDEVTLMRSYRKGDLPDIQIPCSDVVTVLTTLAKRDQLIARQLIVSVYKALVKTDVNPDVSGVSTAMDQILQTRTSHDPSLVATLLEMGLVKPSECHSPASVIAQVCKDSHQMSIGALLVEARLLAEEEPLLPPPTKRMRTNTRNASYDDWMYLAEIYHSLEEKDVVQGLFEDRIAETCGADVREALQAEDQARWKRALMKYKECINAQSGTAAENFLYEASFKCSAQLSDWKELNESLKSTQLQNNMEEVWNDNWNRDHLLPWLFLSEIHRSQETTVLSVAQDFNTALNRWLEDPEKRSHIEAKLSGPLSVLLVLRGDSARAKLLSDASVRQFLVAWQQLDSLNGHLRGSTLLAIHRLMDTDRFLELTPNTDPDWNTKVCQLLDQWNRTFPSKADSLVSWETQAVYRNIFVRKLEAQAEGERELLRKLRSFKQDNYMKTMECALEQGNFYVARKYHGKTKNELGTKASNNLRLSYSQVCLLRAELEPDLSPAKVGKLLSAWDELESLREQDSGGSLGYPLNRSLHSHSADIYISLLTVVQEQPSVLDNLHPAAVEKLTAMDMIPGEVPVKLKDKVVSSLEQAIAASESQASSSGCSALADAYLKLTRFCHHIDDPQYRDKLIQSLLRAMKYNSTEARILFPCLLESSLAEHDHLFKSESAQVPEWMFLSWVAQLLAHLDTDVGFVVAPLVVRLAQTYPEALRFPFHLSREMYQYRYAATKDIVSVLNDLLKLDSTTTKLLKGLTSVCQPHTSLMYHLTRLKSVITQNSGSDAFVEAYVTMKNEAFPPDENDQIKGKVFNDVKRFTDDLDDYFDQLVNKQISSSDFCNKIDEIYAEVLNEHKFSEELKKKRHDHIELARFSPWLANKYNGEIEIPGQYTGEGRPLPNHHVTIAAFRREVIPLSSMRWPTKITIIGSDGKNHPYLVKFGEDLRQDQRIQQLFVLMNQLLSADVTASRRQLSLLTYSVVPLSSRLGIIQWVEKTKTLGDFMFKEHGEKLKRARNIYDVEHYFRCNPAKLQYVASFFKSVKKGESIQYYQRAVRELHPYMMRDAVWKMSTGPESFFHLRTVMLTNHACLSVCHWLLGIGDRHLSNTLVCTDSGRLLGIDFGHAFGTATQLLILPELLPLRLTPQILNLAAPLLSSGLIKETMVHTLKVLREGRRLLLATMKVFILEPSVDWLRAAKRDQAYSEEGMEWFPQQKISLAQRKLEGAHSREVMEEDLKAGHAKYPHYGKLVELLWDEEDPRMRDMPRNGLSARQQVECLISQSTNQHILSKTFSGWMPYV